MFLVSRTLLTTRSRHRFGVKACLFTIWLCEWSFLLLSQGESFHFSVSPNSLLYQAPKTNQSPKLGNTQSHLDENLQVAVGLQPKLARWCCTAWSHCLAGPCRGSGRQCLPVCGHLPLLCKRSVWWCTRWWHPSFFRHHRGQRHTVTCFPAWTRAKQSISIPRVGMPKILAQSRRFPSAVSHLSVPAPTPRLSLPGGEPATCGVTGFKWHGLKALLRARTFVSACLQ